MDYSLVSRLAAAPLPASERDFHVLRVEHRSKRLNEIFDVIRRRAVE